MNRFDMMREAMEEAEQTQRAADRQVGAMARMIAGRLRKGYIPSHVLEELKRELKDYNIQTRRWMR